jgi:hemin uptake protein HemP
VRIQVSDLLSGKREAVLLHDGQEYRLRLTSKGQLILTK